MFVFIDESGNSGQNMADKDSPFFYHLALLSKYNIDYEYKSFSRANRIWKEFCEKNG